MGSNPSVPFLDLAAQHVPLRSEIDAAVKRTLDRGDFILGEQLREFEASFAQYIGADYAIGVSSGTAALHLSLLAMDVGPGDEVITVSMSFVATVEAIQYTGAIPVFVDVDPDTFCMDPAQLERAITPKTKAIMPVHLYGQPCDMESIMAIAAKHGLLVLEDTAQAHGATFAGKKVGSFGAAGAFSFYPTKNLGCVGDGGAVITNDANIAKRVTALRHHAQYDANVFAHTGYNCRLDSIQAGILKVKLPHLDDWNQRRQDIVDRYRERLHGTEYRFQGSVPGTTSSYYILAVKHPRQQVVHSALDDAGIGWGRHIVPPIHRQPGYEHLVRNGETLPVSESLVNELISLPVYPELTNDQVDYVADTLGKVEVSV